MKAKATQLNCFSPPVMIMTLVIEVVLALYTAWRYKLNVLGRLVLGSLLALAAFQLCEYHVCRGSGLSATEWSRAGFIAITLLPALGTHMLYVLAGKPDRKLVTIAYALMASFCAYFLLAPKAFSGYACTGNYVIFQIGIKPAIAYALYYYGLLVAGISLGWRWGKQLPAVQSLIIGYLIFLVPTALANSVKPETRRGIPSIMCGFAVLFALLLTLRIIRLQGIKRIVKTNSLKQSSYY